MKGIYYDALGNLIGIETKEVKSMINGFAKEVHENSIRHGW